MLKSIPMNLWRDGMITRKKIKRTSGIRHAENVDIANLPEGTDDDVSEMLKKDKSKIRITTLIDTDILDELKRRANSEGDGRYQTYLNQFLRQALFSDSLFDEKRVIQIVKTLVKPDALRRRRA
jgi:uncharacterized protein (DUF4415 family)